MKFFVNVKSYDDLKKQYRTLAIKNHPDNGGNVETMKEINNEYDILFPVWKRSSHIETKETAESTRSEFYTQNGWKGENYNSSRSLKEIAAIVREYVKKQYPTYKFSITTHYASMCQELAIYLTEAPTEVYKTESEWNEDEKLKAWRAKETYHVESKFLKDTVQAMFDDIDTMVNSYNRSDCDGMIDYFDVDFYYFGCKVSEGEKPLKIVPKTARIGNANYKDKGITVSDKQPETASEQPKTAYTYTVTEDTDTRDNSKIWIVKINEKLSKDEYITVNQQIKTIGGYYSKFKHGFLFKTEPSEVLNTLFTGNSEQQVKDNVSEENTVKTTKQEQKAVNNTVLKDKISKQIESTQKKIDSLSGDYKTNTWKRMNEQANRDKKIEGFRQDISILNYLLNTLEIRSLTTLESCLVTSAWRDMIEGYYKQHEAFLNSTNNSVRNDAKYPEFNREYPDSWWNIEVPKIRKRLAQANIKNTEQLIQAVEQYKMILNSLHDQNTMSKQEQQIKQAEREAKMQQKGDIQFTPPEIAEQLVNLARIDEHSKVLEPSAGIGSIADIIRKITKNIDVCEYNYSFSNLLKLKGYNVVGNDFLEYNSEPVYDAIIMNPPFSNNQDIEHLQHAYSMLKTGGTLVCITSPHWSFANDKKSINFRNWFENQDGYTQELESNTFEMTGVKSQIVVIKKHEQQEERTA